MAFLVHPLPPVDVFVKKEYLYDMEKGWGEVTPGIWVSVKSVRGKALYFETLLTDYGALYDKLPISAFVWKVNRQYDLPLESLQIWDCFDYDITVIEKPLLGYCKFFEPNKKELHSGRYLFTIDTCHFDSSILNVGLSEHDPEHKSFNVIKLDNGQFAAQPNNRILWQDSSLILETVKKADFKVCTQNYSIEGKNGWNVADSSEWQYKSKYERE
jgi:hypothetical protein